MHLMAFHVGNIYQRFLPTVFYKPEVWFDNIAVKEAVDCGGVHPPRDFSQPLDNLTCGYLRVRNAGNLLRRAKRFRCSDDVSDMVRQPVGLAGTWPSRDSEMAVDF